MLAAVISRSTKNVAPSEAALSSTRDENETRLESGLTLTCPLLAPSDHAPSTVHSNSHAGMLQPPIHSYKSPTTYVMYSHSLR